MDVLHLIAGGFAVAIEPQNILYVFVGVFIGMVIGVLPGLGPAPTIALLLPLTYVIPPASAILMLAGIYYGAYYGGTVTSVMLRLPGELASVVTVFDGYAMAQKGRAGSALGIAAIGSFVGALFAVVGMMFLAPVVAGMALRLGPPEYTILAVVGLLLACYLGTGSLARGIAAASLGVLVAAVGTDPVSGVPRMTFGSVELFDGVDFIAVVMGLFGLGEILYNLESEGKLKGDVAPLGTVWPSRSEISESKWAIARGSVLGFFLGVLPGGGGAIGSMASYATEKRLAKDPSRFGKGAIEGVAGPETANNAGSTSAFIPLLTLGIPPNVVLALIFGALLIQGITPGPQLIQSHPEVFWGVISSMVIGNLMLLIMSMPFVRVFVKLAQVRMGIIATVVVGIMTAGVYSLSSSMFDVGVMIVFGIIGYLMRKCRFEPGPFALAMMLGPIVEGSLRQSLALSQHGFLIFVERTVSVTMLASVALLVVISVVIRRRRPGVLETVRSGEI